MSPPLLRLARWARELTVSAVPADVLHLTRLRFLAAAGGIHAAAATNAGAEILTRIVGGTGAPAGRADLGANAEIGASLLARFAMDDWQLGGRLGLASLPFAGERAAGHTLDELLVAVIAAEEIAGRIGLATLLSARASHSALWPAAAAGAAVVALLDGRNAEGIAEAVAGAVSRARRQGGALPLSALDADPARLGAEVVAAVRAGLIHGGAHSLLDADHPFWDEVCTRPLPGALTGEGEAWLSRSVVVPPEPGLPWTQVPVQAVGEILRRHVKAAERRLRVDQVERIEIHVPWLAWALDQAAASLPGPGGLLGSIPRLCAVRIAHHLLTPAQLDPAAIDAHAADLTRLAGLVHVVHDWEPSFATVRGVSEALGPVLSGFGRADYRALRGRLKAQGEWPRWSPAEARTLIAAPVLPILRALRTPAGDLTRCALHPFVWPLPVRVRLYTTRGGWWPERRAQPEGTVAGGDLAYIARARFGDETRADTFLACPGTTPAPEALAGLSAR